MEDMPALIGRALSYLDLPPSTQIHLREQDPVRGNGDDDDELADRFGLREMLPPVPQRLSSISRITHMELVFYTKSSTPWVAIKGRSGDGDEECLRADVFPQHFRPAVIADVFSGPEAPYIAHLTHLSIQHLCSNQSGRSWDVLLLAVPHLVSLDAQGLHVDEILLALEHASDPATARPACPALKSLRVGFEFGTDGVETQYLQGTRFVDAQSLLRVRVAALAALLRRREERSAPRPTSLEFFDTYFINAWTKCWLRVRLDIGGPADTVPLVKTGAPPRPIVDQLLEPLRTLVDGRLVWGGYRSVTVLVSTICLGRCLAD